MKQVLGMDDARHLVPLQSQQVPVIGYDQRRPAGLGALKHPVVAWVVLDYRQHTHRLDHLGNQSHSLRERAALLR